MQHATMTLHARARTPRGMARAPGRVRAVRAPWSARAVAGPRARTARPRRRPGRDPGPAGRAAHARLRDDPGAGGLAPAAAWRPSPGSVYPTLQLLEDEGLIAGEEGEGRRRFTLTDAGRVEAERQGQGQAPWEQVTAGVAPAAWNLRDAIAQIAQAAWSVGAAGNEAQQARALEILNEARRRLYAILAEAGRPRRGRRRSGLTSAEGRLHAFTEP